MWRSVGVTIFLVLIAQSVALRASPTIDHAKILIAQGRFEDAKRELQGESVSRTDATERFFLLGLVAMQLDRPREAIDHFRAALVLEPGAVRIRLELARAFFTAKDFTNAQRQFERARAGNPPAAVIANIDRFMAAIRNGRTWSTHVGFAIAPDSNINGATSARQTVFFGLPFELSDSARRKSGVGVDIEGGLVFTPRLSERTRLRVSAAAERQEYRGNLYDDTLASLEVGPVWTRRRWQAGIFATGMARRIGTLQRLRGAGGRIDVSYFPSSRSVIPISVGIQKVRFAKAPLYDSTIVNVQGGFARAFTPTTIGAARLEWTRRKTVSDFSSSRTQAVALSASHDFPYGFSLTVQPRVEWSQFDGPDPFAMVDRRDRLEEISLALINRRLTVRGFTPRAAVTFSHRNSNVTLYDIQQRRLELGLTSDF